MSNCFSGLGLEEDKLSSNQVVKKIQQRRRSFLILNHAKNLSPILNIPSLALATFIALS